MAIQHFLFSWPALWKGLTYAVRTSFCILVSWKVVSVFHQGYRRMSSHLKTKQNPKNKNLGQNQKVLPCSHQKKNDFGAENRCTCTCEWQTLGSPVSSLLLRGLPRPKVKSIFLNTLFFWLMLNVGLPPKSEHCSSYSPWVKSGCQAWSWFDHRQFHSAHSWGNSVIIAWPTGKKQPSGMSSQQ